MSQKEIDLAELCNENYATIINNGKKEVDWTAIGCPGNTAKTEFVTANWPPYCEGSTNASNYIKSLKRRRKCKDYDPNHNSITYEDFKKLIDRYMESLGVKHDDGSWDGPAFRDSHYDTWGVWYKDWVKKGESGRDKEWYRQLNLKNKDRNGDAKFFYIVKDGNRYKISDKEGYDATEEIQQSYGVTGMKAVAAAKTAPPVRKGGDKRKSRKRTRRRRKHKKYSKKSNRKLKKKSRKRKRKKRTRRRRRKR